MKIKYQASFVGYIPVLRAVQLLLKDSAINFSHLGAYIAFVMQADWDRKHDNYKVIIRDDQELAKAWCCSISTVHRKRKELIKLGLLTEKEGITEVTNFYIFEKDWIKIFSKLPESVLNDMFATTHEKIEKSEYYIAEMEKKQVQKTVQNFNFPSKDKLSLSNQDIEDINSSLEGVVE